MSVPTIEGGIMVRGYFYWFFVWITTAFDSECLYFEIVVSVPTVKGRGIGVHLILYEFLLVVTDPFARELWVLKPAIGERIFGE
ncbi:hypothetical protein NLX69_09935 [Rossellomorea sp. BNER]|nr:hypothetical protein [Rossellomorea sp. BNER]